jgi:hypothetical protein
MWTITRIARTLPLASEFTFLCLSVWCFYGPHEPCCFHKTRAEMCTVLDNTYFPRLLFSMLSLLFILMFIIEYTVFYCWHSQFPVRKKCGNICVSVLHCGLQLTQISFTLHLTGGGTKGKEEAWDPRKCQKRTMSLGNNERTKMLIKHHKYGILILLHIVASIFLCLWTNMKAYNFCRLIKFNLFVTYNYIHFRKLRRRRERNGIP